MKRIRLNLTLKFLLGTGAVLATTLGVLFYMLVKGQEKLIYSRVEKEAKTVFKQIVLTRSWIADHGGIFVEKLPWVKSGEGSDEITGTGGRRLVKKTPAMVTKDLSVYARGKGFYWFHITSLKLVNPENAPDQFERESLIAFEEKKVSERAMVEKIDSIRYFRYIAPLYVERACLGCHEKQGYRIGDVRGAISVTIPMEDVFAQMKSNRINMLLVAALTTVVLLTALYMMMIRMVLSPVHKLNSSIKAFASGVHSVEADIRTGDELEDLGKSFAYMARTISGYHITLETQIKNAVRDLEETNKRLLHANEQLIEMDRKKSDFVAKTSHELRTPLTAIKGAMDYISVRLMSLASDTGSSRDAENAAKIADLLTFFDLIKKNAERLIRMVNDLLDLERIEQGRSEMHFSETDAAALINDVVTGFRSSAMLQDRTIEVRTSADLFIRADEDRIRQVLINLLSNALKYSPEGSIVTIRALAEEGCLTVIISDQGPGIPVEEQDKIFDRFYTRGDKKGTGLGLAISKGIIEAHGGTIGVVSDGQQGSSFYFRLPLSAKFTDGQYDTCRR